MSYDNDNIFAKILRGEMDCIPVYEDDDTLCFMDIMPVTRGHTLVVPREPAENLFDLSDEAAAKSIKVVKKVAKAVKTAMDCPGVRIAQFNGVESGQTVFHIHFHIVPAYARDEKLNPHAKQKADPEELKALAEKIRACL